MNNYSLKNDKHSSPLRQTLKRLKTTLFLSLFCFLFVEAGAGFSQSATLSLNMKSVSIKDACKAIERESGYIFAFSENVQSEINKKIDVVAQAQKIEEILDNILNPAGLKYQMFGKQIVIYKNEAKPAPAAIAVPSKDVQQQREIPIKGKIVDERGETMPGVTII